MAETATSGKKIRLLFGIPVVLLLILLLLSAVSHMLISRQTYEDQISLAIHDSKQLMLLMKRSAEVFVAQDIQSELIHLFSSINDHEHLMRFRYITGDGKVRYSSIFYEVNETVNPSEMNRFANIGFTELARHDKDGYFSIVMPIRDVSRDLSVKVGVIVGRFGTHYIKDLVEEKMERSFLNSVIVIAAIVLLLMIVLFFTLSRPISNIKRSLVHLARKKYDVNIQDSIWSEFSDLAYHGNRTKELLQKADQYEKEQQEYKDQFVASVSHELRTPLNGIIGLSELLKKQNLTHSQGQYIQKIHMSAQMLLDVVNEILDYSKIQAGHLSIEMLPTDIHKDFNHVFSVLTHLAHSKGIDFHIFIDPSIQHRVLSDPLRLQQVINNLCSNAIKFTHEGKVMVSIDPVEETDTTITLCFKVMDTGIGIGEDVLPNLFQAFKQSDNTTSRHFGGTGLGLFISEQIVEALGGSIYVESRLEQGSTFEFSLEMEKMTDQDISKSDPEQEVDIQLGKKSVMIVDDNLINLEVASSLMADYFGKVSTAESGQESIDLINESVYDVILMDIQMPGMSGIEAMNKIRQVDGYGNACIIALTANVMKQDVEHYMSEGFDDVQSKPFKAHELAKKIQRCLLKQSVNTSDS